MCARPARSTPPRRSTHGRARDEQRDRARRRPRRRRRAPRWGRAATNTSAAMGATDGGAHEEPQRRAEPLAILGADADTARCLLHYPRWVTETVDVLIIAPDVPAYAHPGDAGADLVAAEAVRLEPGQRALVGTGVRIALPEGFVAFVVPRSGLATKHGITIVNSPGTVDAGYRGEIKVTLLNTDTEAAYDIAVGDRIAQLIVMPVTRAQFIPVDDAARKRPRRRRLRIDRLSEGTEYRRMTESRTPDRRQRPTTTSTQRRPRLARSREPGTLRRVRGQPGAPVHRSRRHQDPSPRGPQPASRGRGADQAHRRGRPRLRRLHAAGAAVRRAALRRGSGRRRASRSAVRSASRAAASRSAKDLSVPSCSPRCPSRPVPTARPASVSHDSSASTVRAGSCAA